MLLQYAVADAQSSSNRAIMHKVPRGMGDDIKAAVNAAQLQWKNGAGVWASLSCSERSHYVRKMCAGIRDNQAMLAAIESAARANHSEQQVR